MTPNIYYIDIVQPTLVEYYNDNNNQRKAILAAMCMLHVVDCIAASKKDTKGELNGEVSRITKEMMQYIEFEVVRGLALSYKHFKVHNKDYENSEVRINRVSFPSFAGKMYANLTCLGDKVGGLIVSQGKGEKMRRFKLHTLFSALESRYGVAFPELLKPEV